MAGTEGFILVKVYSICDRNFTLYHLLNLIFRGWIELHLIKLRDGVSGHELLKCSLV